MMESCWQLVTKVVELSYSRGTKWYCFCLIAFNIASTLISVFVIVNFVHSRKIAFLDVASIMCTARFKVMNLNSTI